MSTAEATKPSQKHQSLAVIIQGVEFDKLLLHSFSGTEGLSRLFRFDLEMLSLASTHVPASEVIGKKVVIRLAEKGKGHRYFIGLINRFSWTGKDHDFHHYHAEVVPWTWKLTLTSDCRIFQRKTIPQIIQQIFDENGFKSNEHYQLKLNREYTAIDYVVQYRETDFNFVSRLMEQEGIFYYFEHSYEKGGNGDSAPSPSHLKNLMVLVDQNDRGSSIDAPIAYVPHAGQGDTAHDRIYAWHETSALRPTRYTLRDYHFERSESDLEVSKPAKNKLGDGEWEIFDYPGEYAQRFDKPEADQGKVKSEAQTTARLRMEEEESPLLVSGGSSNCRAFIAGSLFTLHDHPCPSFNQAYLVTSVHHAAETAPPYIGGHHQGHGYHNSFTCMPQATPFRPPRVTPKPVIQGLQNAVVVGSKDKEVEVDRWGRVKVQFQWDRYGKKDLDSSCWVRVAQAWAGKRWGTFFWPRIGQEVLVAFQEGDPEEPIIVGSAYNDAQPVPYLGDGFDEKHPHNPNLTGIKTNSTLGGKGYNELRFNDTKDKEQIYIHGQRDMDVRIRHTSRERVVHDRHLVVGWEQQDEDDPDATTKKGGDQREMVYQDKHLHVHRNQVEHVEGNQMLMVGKGEAEDGGNVQIFIEKDKIQTIEGNYLMHIIKTLGVMVDGAISLILNSSVTTLIKGNQHQKVEGEKREKIAGPQSLSIGGDHKQKVGGSNHLTVGGDQSEKVGGTQSLTAGADLQQKVGQNAALDAGQEIHIKAGMKVIIEAGAQLSLKGPGGFVDIGPSGVTIVGTIVNINSGGSAGSGSGAKPNSPQPPDEPDDASQNKPKDAEKAKPTKPTQADGSVSGFKSAPG